MHNSQIFYDYCVWNDESSALRTLHTFSDINILYDDGGIIQSICIKNNPRILQAALNDFENTQFPVKDDKYTEAHERLVAILEECIQCVDPSSETYGIISKYIDSDIARLSDVEEEHETYMSRASSETDPSQQHRPLTTALLAEHNNQYAAYSSAHSGSTAQHSDVAVHEMGASVTEE